MRILLFHPTLLPPKDYGGVERVVLWLAQGLVESGHDVSVAALPGSQLPPGCKLHEVEKKNFSKSEFLQIFNKDFDVVHFMAPIQSDHWDALPVPSVLTVHGNGQDQERFPKNSVFLSQDHANRHSAQSFIYNGIDPAEYLFQPLSKNDSFLFFSKTSWSVKNLAGAMKFCRDAQVRLKVAGGNRPWLKRLECFLRPSMQWIGPVAGRKKAELLTSARALVFPVKWPEPFGLVVAEALVSGTPVIASPLGSLPELLPNDVGCLPKSDDEWIEVLSRKVQPWAAERCRQWALEKFHYLRMTQEYEQAYRKVMTGKSLNETNPIGRNWRT